MKLLDQKVAIITGGSMGIGEATAELFAQHGAKVVITGRHREALDEMAAKIRTDGGEVHAIVADAASLEDCKRVFQETLEVYGDIDILVNNAGTSSLYAIDTTTDEEWEKVVALNLSGVFHYCREAVTYMLEKNKGNIVNISSMNGVRPVSGCSYSVTKRAVNALSESIAMRCAGTPVRCNTVCPGGTDTPLMQSAFVNGEIDPNILDGMQKRIDLTLPNTKPIDQAWAILFLASDYARAITGAELHVDHGSFL